MKNNFLRLVFGLCSLLSFSQSYQFETVTDIEATAVISQGKTGTCWSFSTSSFLESEIIRLTGQSIDISEIYNVRHTYPKKAWSYVMRQGKAQFSEGGLAHDVINSISEFGLVPNSIYSGLPNGKQRHDHSKLADSLKTILDQYLKSPKDYKGDWKLNLNNVLDSYLGATISNFEFEGKTYTPLSFLEYTKINPNDYITITSFTHVPYYANFVLNIPDNFSNGTFLNVPLDDLVSITNNALKKGYTIELDCDVSEKTFSAKHGIAVIPQNKDDNTKILTEILPEKEINASYRQEEFENFNTTDDHLMHITGIVKDQKGNTYYKVKNSWGSNSSRVSNGGYIYMSEAYFMLKTISIMVHKDILPSELQNKALTITD
ncbi:C1 family peptidase [Aestuariivivens insulae]|uniref:C1 family peptidase n=1 Tax=Aestuariivivens insulae TaxID=1621988 RepID=UPI001F59FEA4|nr:C1 family peptidase [Aestuariivivens insulae]